MRLPSPSTPHDVVLYDRYEQRFLTYDTAARRVTQRSNASNYFQYEFPTPSAFYTAGDSLRGGFTILRRGPRHISTVATVAANYAVFPLATGRAGIYFYRTRGIAGDRRIMRLDGHTLRTVARIGRSVESAALVGESLYFTADDGSAGGYRLMQIDLSTPHPSPQTVRTNLSDSAIFAHDGRILIRTDGHIRDGRSSFSCPDLCYFFDTEHLFARIVNDDSGDVVVEIDDTRSHRLVRRVVGVLDFRVTKHGLVVYRDGSVVRVRNGS